MNQKTTNKRTRNAKGPYQAQSLTIPLNWIKRLDLYIAEVQRVRSITPLTMDMKVQALLGYLESLKLFKDNKQ